MTQNCITVWDRHSACGTTGDENLRPYPCLSHPPCFQAGLAGWPRCRAPRSGCRRGEAASQIWERTRDRKMRRPGAWGMRAAAADEDSRDLAEVSVVEFEGEGGGGDDRTQTTLDMHWSQTAQQRDAPPMCKFHCVRSALGMWCASHMARCSLGARRRPRACQRKLS